MAEAPGLDALGPRLCILGPSNSGKSTLACAIEAARGMPAIHLDRLHHLPDTDWQPRPEAAFRALHDAALAADTWVMEGNYTRYLPQRLARATGLILLDLPMPVSLWRYVRRCWFERNRAGGLEGGRDSVKWDMLRHIAVTTPVNRRRYAALFDELTIPARRLATPAALAAFYRSEGLSRD